jgi:hypothetical protein
MTRYPFNIVEMIYGKNENAVEYTGDINEVIKEVEEAVNSIKTVPFISALEGKDATIAKQILYMHYKDGVFFNDIAKKLNITKDELDLWQMRLFRKMRSLRSGIPQKLRKYANFC